MLADKRLIITGIATTDSIAFAVAQRALEEGAQVIATTLGRDRELTEQAVAQLPEAVEVFELDATRPRGLRGSQRASAPCLGRGGRSTSRHRVRAAGRSRG